MHTHKIIDLMNPMEHCPSCGALLVTVPGGGICPHCGFEVEDPEEAEILAFRNTPGRAGGKNSFASVDDWPEDVFDEVA